MRQTLTRTRTHTDLTQAQAVLCRALAREVQPLRQLVYLPPGPETETRQFLAVRAGRRCLFLALLRVDVEESTYLEDEDRIPPSQPYCHQPSPHPGQSSRTYTSSSWLMCGQITLSHFACSTEDLGPTESFPSRQLRTTMDVICSPEVEFLHGGLHLQVTHHLFPRLPRHNLRAASLLVKEYCKEQDINYREHGFIEG